MIKTASRRDPVHVVCGLAALERAEGLAASLAIFAPGRDGGMSCQGGGDYRWVRIAQLYEQLARLTR